MKKKKRNFLLESVVRIFSDISSGIKNWSIYWFKANWRLYVSLPIRERSTFIFYYFLLCSFSLN
jgi:hypothetical protein